MDDTTAAYGVRQHEIDSIRQRSVENDAIEIVSALSRSLQNVKADIQKLQHEHALSISNSIKIDERLESVKVDMIELSQKILSSASVELVQNMKQTMETKCLRAEQNLDEFKSSFIIQVNGQIVT
jgi:hypothetical protein